MVQRSPPAADAAIPPLRAAELACNIVGIAAHLAGELARLITLDPHDALGLHQSAATHAHSVRALADQVAYQLVDACLSPAVVQALDPDADPHAAPRPVRTPIGTVTAFPPHAPHAPPPAPPIR